MTEPTPPAEPPAGASSEPSSEPSATAPAAAPADASPQPSAESTQGAAQATSDGVVSGSAPKEAAPRLVVVPGPKRSLGRAPLVIAVVGIVAALAAGAVLYLRGRAEPPMRTPEATVQEFLAAVFLAEDPQRVAEVVCASWDPIDAIERTTGEVDPDVRVTWDGVGVVTTEPGRITVRARLGLRQLEDVRPADMEQWRFTLVDQDGWRVCEARPLVG